MKEMGNSITKNNNFIAGRRNVQNLKNQEQMMLRQKGRELVQRARDEQVEEWQMQSIK